MQHRPLKTERNRVPVPRGASEPEKGNGLSRFSSRRAVVCGLLFFLGPSLCWGQGPFGGRIDSLIQAGIAQTIRSAYDSALVTFARVEAAFPGHPVGPFYRAAVYQAAMMDYETDRWESEFYQAVEEAIRIGEEALKQRNDPWLLFYLGSAYGYKGLYQVREGAILAGFRSAHRGVGLLETAVKEDPSLSDALLFIGNYKYWSGKFYKLLSWLPFIRDERSLGLSLIHQAVRKGTFSKWVGLNSLGWIEYDRRRYQEGLTAFEEGAARFPDSRFYLWGLGACYHRLGRWHESAAVHARLLASIRSAPIRSLYNEAECRMKLMEALAALGDSQGARLQAEAILALEVDEKEARRIASHRKRAEEFQRRCVASSR